MRRPGWLLALVAFGCVAFLGIGFVAMVGGMLGVSQDDGTGGCSSEAMQAEPLPAFGHGVGGLTRQQLEHAGIVIVEGRRLGVPPEGIVVALATASQESRFRNYANDGRGTDIGVLQSGVSQSLALPHDAVGSDHGSVGIFQQQWPWWGSLTDLMDPAKSADKFYAALMKVHGWQQMPVTVAAQRVQRSAFPDAYADDEALARQLLRSEGGSADVQAASYSSGGAADCSTSDAVATGPVVFPLPRSASYVDQRNYGGHGDHWVHMHTGTDLSAACGTPVLAVTAGRVVVRTDQAWAGRWLVQVSTGTGQLTTWYAHMRALTVTDGEQVPAGQQIGEVGDLGNATGCHLHLEVHPRGGTIYQDSTDPTAWLRQHVGRQTGPAIVPVGSTFGPSSRHGWFTIATFNVLGASHTARGGSESGMASGTSRMRGVVRLLASYGVDLVGFQELQASQHRSLRARVGARYTVWSPPGDTENAIAWRRDRFRLVRARPVSVPYFDGHPRRMPVVLLKDRVTGQRLWLGNFHNPAETGRYHHQGRFRAAAKRVEMRLVARLARTRRPVFLTGDMNERASYFCSMTSSGVMHAAAGGHPHPCRAPQGNGFGIDWIFGSREVGFSHFTVDRGRLVRRTTDHPLVVARAISARRER